jgi:hypothetical protein
VVTLRDMLRVWDERMLLLQHKPSTSMAPMTMRCAYLETVNHFVPIRSEMMSGDYRHLVETFDKHFAN